MTEPVPSAEAVVSIYLADRDVEHVGTRHPDARSVPWARVVLIDEEGPSQPRHLVGARLQIDCYGGGNPNTAQSEADALSRQVVAELDTAHESDHAGAVISAAIVNSRHRRPDDDFQPARERYIVDVTVWLHQITTGS